MFLTITIDTNQKANKKIKFNQSKVQALKGWKKSNNAKKLGLLRKLKSIFRSFKNGQYKLGKQIIGY